MAAAVCRTCPSEKAERVSFKLWQRAVILYWGVCLEQCRVEAGKREVRNAGCWHWLRVISVVSPSETSRCWKVIQNSTRKLLRRGKTYLLQKISGSNSITLFLIYSAFTLQELRYYPESSPSSTSHRVILFLCFSFTISISVWSTQEEYQKTEHGHASTRSGCPHKL